MLRREISGEEVGAQGLGGEIEKAAQGEISGGGHIQTKPIGSSGQQHSEEAKDGFPIEGQMQHEQAKEVEDSGGAFPSATPRVDQKRSAFSAGRWWRG